VELEAEEDFSLLVLLVFSLLLLLVVVDELSVLDSVLDSEVDFEPFSVLGASLPLRA